MSEQKDFYDDEGCLICGVCGECKAFPSTSMPFFQGEKRLIRCNCKCQKDAYEAEQEAFRNRERQIYIDSIRRASITDDRSRKSTFDSYKVDDSNRAAYDIALEYMERFDEMMEPDRDKRRGLLFYGNPGTGKTFTADCIVNALIEKGRTAFKTSIPRLIDQFQDFNNDINQIMNAIRTVDVMVIDDLGTESGSDFRLEKMFEIIDTRYGADKPTIVTTNLAYQQMENVSDIRYARIFDRVRGMCYPVEMRGRSFRDQGVAD